MKKVYVFFVVVAVGVGLYFFLGREKVSEVSLMKEAVVAVDAYQNGGDASEAITKLEDLARELSEYHKNSKGTSEDAEESPEMKAEAERLRGELVNASMDLEISEKAEAQAVSKALDQFMGQ